MAIFAFPLNNLSPPPLSSTRTDRHPFSDRIPSYSPTNSPFTQPQALRRAATRASDPSYRLTLADEARAVLTFAGPVPAPATAPGAALTDPAGEAEGPVFGSFDAFIANCTSYLRARGLPPNTYSMNGIVRNDIDLSNNLIQVSAA